VGSLAVLKGHWFENQKHHFLNLKKKIKNDKKNEKLDLTVKGQIKNTIIIAVKEQQLTVS